MAGRLTIIGGGVMGLMTAYYAAPLPGMNTGAVTVLERSRVGDPATASFGLTRSVRNDFRDPAYARLAFEARQLWRELERSSGERLLVDCGCLNLVKFAPWVGRVLAQLAVQRGTVYDIGRFTPARFAGGAPVTGVAS